MAFAATSRAAREDPRSPSGWKNSSASSSRQAAVDLPLPLVHDRARQPSHVGHLTSPASRGAAVLHVCHGDTGVAPAPSVCLDAVVPTLEPRRTLFKPPT